MKPCYKIDFAFQKNLQYLDLSYKTEVDIPDSFGRENLHVMIWKTYGMVYQSLNTSKPSKVTVGVSALNV